MRRVKRELLVWCILGITLQCMVGCGDDESIGNGPLMGRNYVQYEQAPNGLITGVGASILTRYGELYDHGDTTKEDIALAYCSAARVRSNYNDTIWAQMGFAHHKPRNFIVTFHSYYCEIMGDIWNMWYSSFPDGFPNPDSLSPPFEGWDYNYRCELNPESGLWDFCYDYSFVETGFYSHEVWKIPATSISWAGEINDPWHDMPGTEFTPCEFKDLQYRYKGDINWTILGHNPTEKAWTSDPTEWGIEVLTGTGNDIETIKIWDIKPL